MARWAERKGKTVEWGNIIMGMCGQQFRETFKTEKQAEERERQAKAGESIGDRKPIPIKREKI